MTSSGLPHVTHVPMPFSTQGSTLLTVVEQLSRAYAGVGGRSSVILSDNRDLHSEAVPAVYVDFTENCPRERFSRAEVARDVIVGYLGGERPAYGPLFDPAIRATAAASTGGIVLLYEGHYASASLPRWRDVRQDAQVVLYVHNPVSRSYRRRELRRLLSSADRVVFCADHLRHNVEDRLDTHPSTFETVHNGVDHAFFGPKRRASDEGKDFTVLFFGRVAENKGVHLALDAAERAQSATARRVRVRVVGSANYHGGMALTGYEEELRRRAGRMAVAVDFVPFASRAAVIAELATSDVACLLSTWAEGFPLTVLEAMAAGVPVVCSDSPGMREAAGDAARVVHMGEVDEAAAAIAMLAEDGDAWTHHSLAGRARAESFTWERAIRAIAGVPVGASD